MTQRQYQLSIDREGDVLSFVIDDEAGVLIGRSEIRIQGPGSPHVDNILLTAIDNLLSSYRIPTSALQSVQIGAGIDKDSSLYRIVTSFASAVHATGVAFRGG